MREKKRTGAVLGAGAICALGVLLGSGAGAQAEEAAIRSRGNIVLREGAEVAVYAEDLSRLQEEVDRLYAELP